MKRERETNGNRFMSIRNGECCFGQMVSAAFHWRVHIISERNIWPILMNTGNGCIECALCMLPLLQHTPHMHAVYGVSRWKKYRTEIVLITNFRKPSFIHVRIERQTGHENVYSIISVGHLFCVYLSVARSMRQQASMDGPIADFGFKFKFVHFCLDSGFIVCTAYR